jgi:hypothetical protein
VFEAIDEKRSSSPASAVWARWAKPERWPEWDKRIQGAELRAPATELAEGAELRVKLRHGGTTRQVVTSFEPGRRLVTEYALPGAKAGHEHLVESRGPGSVVTHRLYVEGPMSWLWATMVGRRKLREAAAKFTDAD